MSVAKTILSQIKRNAFVFMSWGADQFVDMGTNFTLSFGENDEKRTFNCLGALMFKVRGFLHKGLVLIVLEGDDTYTVHLLKAHRKDGKLFTTLEKSLPDVYCDMLQTVVDTNVERDPKIYANARF